MSELGHAGHFDGLPMTSDLPPEADIVTAGGHVSKVPESDIAAQEIWRTFSCILLTRHAEVRK